MNEAEQSSTELTNGPEASKPMPYPTLPFAEAQVLAQELADAYKRRIQYQEGRKPETPEDEAEAKARDEAYRLNLRAMPPRSMSWWGMNELQEFDGEQAALEKFWEIKNAALDELQTGNRSVKALVGGQATPFEWAEYCALIHELGADWKPKSGIERILIEQMAQAYTMQLYWTDILGGRVRWQAVSVNRGEREYQLPRVTEAQALEMAAGMIDRWNRMFLRVLRQMRDLRRYSPPVIVQNAGQVNVGGQQVNVSAPGGAG